MRLSTKTLARVPQDVERFDYDRAAQAVGIVHFGVGAFHRAHQAWYTDAAMSAGDRDWMIAGVSLRSPAVSEQLNPQDGLYTLCERSGAGDRLRIGGAIREVLGPRQGPAALASRLASPATHVVSLTITEKGYCRAPDGSLDPALAREGSAYHHLAHAMRQRRAAGLAGFTLVPCDNLAGNGAQLARLMGEYLDRHDPRLRGWFEAECACPSTMVDRIVPAGTDADRVEIAARLGLDDQAAVVTEPFSQWIIEDRFAGPRPRWEEVGAGLVSDVAPYETAKLRMLNGAHSALAYLGLERGHTFVHQAIADPAIRRLVERLMRDEAAASFEPAPGQDLEAYACALLARFANPALNHRLAQIAMDGSQKIPQRWLETLEARAAKGTRCPAILAALGAWLRYVRGDRGAVDDPLADRLAATWQGVDLAGAAARMFGSSGVLAGDWTPQPDDIRLMILSADEAAEPAR